MHLNVTRASSIGLLFFLALSLLFLGCPLLTDGTTDTTDEDTVQDDTTDDSSDGSATGTSAEDAVTLTLGTWHDGTADNDRVWFKAAVTGGASYRINWDDWDVTNTNADLVMDAFHEDAATEYFSGRDTYAEEDSDGTLYVDVAVPAGETSLYVVADSSVYEESGAFRVKVTSLNAASPATLTLSESSLDLTVGATGSVTASAEDPDGNAESVSAESSDTGVATVSLDNSTITVTGVAAGSATVTVTSASNLTAGIDVTVSPATTTGSWSQVGTAAIGTVGDSSTYNAPDMAFDGDGNPYVAYIDDASGDVGVKRSTDGSSWTALGGGPKGFFVDESLSTPESVLGSMSPVVAVAGSATSGRVYVNAESTSLSYQNMYSIDLADSGTWVGPYGDAFNDDTSDYGSWSSASPLMEELGGSLYLMHKSGSDASLLSNDGTDLTLTQAVSSLGFGIGSRLAVKDADAFAIVDTVWQDPARRVVVYTGTATGGFTSVDTTTVNEIIDTSGFSDYGISSIDAAYNPASGDLGVVASDAGGETALFEYDGTSWSKVGESITAADADDYTVVRLVYDSTGTAYVVTGSTGSTWTGALRYDASAGAWEQLADAPNSSTKLSAVGVGNDTLHVCGAQNLGDSYAAYVWTFSE